MAGGMRVLVTGATGFVGKTLCATLAEQGYRVRAALRAEQPVPTCVSETTVVGDIGASTVWDAALDGVDAIVHLAARAHVLNDSSENADLYLEANARGTGRLAEAAAKEGIQRFVFLSSIKVNGEDSSHGAYTALDQPRPGDAYGTSKWLAEKSLAEVTRTTGMKVAVVRSPLVYGPGVRANFLRLMRWVDGRWPLPLGAIANRRSIVSVWNLCSLLAELLENSSAAGTWMVSDGDDLSTPELIRRIGRSMGRHVRLLSVPVGLLRTVGRLAGRDAEMARLCGSLVVDISQTRLMLGWSPPVPTDEALARTVEWYRSQERFSGI